MHRRTTSAAFVANDPNRSSRWRRSCNGNYGMSLGLLGSLWLDVARVDHLTPLLDLISDQFAAVGRRAWQYPRTHFGEPCLDRRISQSSVDLAISACQRSRPACSSVRKRRSKYRLARRSARCRAGKEAPNLHACRRSGRSRTGFEPMTEQAALLSVQFGRLSHRPDPMIKVVIRFRSVADA